MAGAENISEPTERIWGVEIALISCVSLGIIFPYFLFSWIKKKEKKWIDSVPLLQDQDLESFFVLLSAVDG